MTEQDAVDKYVDELARIHLPAIADALQRDGIALEVKTLTALGLTVSALGFAMRTELDRP